MNLLKNASLYHVNEKLPQQHKKSLMQLVGRMDTKHPDYLRLTNTEFKKNYPNMLKHIANPKSQKPAYEYFQEQPDRRKNEILRSDLVDVKA